MQDSERRQRVISSTPHLTPDEIASRTFGTKVRGFSDSEVRVFLKRVAEEVSLARDRERELEGAIDALEEQLRAPRPLSEQELLDALGEETARLLRSAREASDDIRRKAEERAKAILEEAQASADRTRAEADDVLASRTQVADAKVAVMVGEAEAHAAEIRHNVTAEAEGITESARQRGKEMIDEAKAARERVLGDLVRRRALLQAQIEELRGGRDQLLDAYRTVKRTFIEATEALGQVEARAAAERTTTSEPIDIAAEIAAEIEAIEGTEPGDATELIEVVVVTETEVEIDSNVAIDLADEESETKLADVDSLFARLRAGHEENGVEADAVAESAPAPVAATDEAPAVTEPDPEPEPEGAPTTVNAAEWRTKRAKAIDPLVSSLVKKAKRTAQDDQNALLDAVRRHKGRPHADQVLPAADAALAEWQGVLREAVDAAYGAGRVATGATAEPAGDDLALEAAEAVVIPVRERIAVAIDTGEEGDSGGLVERIGARYREWKNQSLERTLSEVLALAWARGVYDAVPDGAVLWWVPFEEGRCSDCDDNALEPTVKGKQFPTGQPYPPAHVGCKCLLAPADLHG